MKILLLILDLQSINTPPPPAPNLSKIKPTSCHICRFLHCFNPRHIHNKRLPWQHLRLMRIATMCKMTPIGARLNLKSFILISCGVMELSRKVSEGGGRGRNPPPDRVTRLLNLLSAHFSLQTTHFIIVRITNK